MAEETKGFDGFGVKLDLGEPEFAGKVGIPTIYADVVHRPAMISNNIRLVFSRYDYNIHPNKEAKVEENISIFPVAQLVIPFDGLVNFTDQLNGILKAITSKDEKLKLLAEELRATAKKAASDDGNAVLTPEKKL